jgi:hypothetical protein
LSNSYLTNYSNLINWFKAKNNIEVNISDLKDESIIIIKLKNLGDIIAENIGLNISLPLTYKKPELISYDFEFKFNRETGYYNLLIPFLHSGQAFTFEINYSK